MGTSIDDTGLSATGSGTGDSTQTEDDLDDPSLSKPGKHPDVRETLEAGDQPSTTLPGSTSKGSKAGQVSPSKPAAGKATEKGASLGSATSAEDLQLGTLTKDVASSAAGSKAAAADAATQPGGDDADSMNKDTADLVSDLEDAEADAEREAGLAWL